jgi:hypothetical protein
MARAKNPKKAKAKNTRNPKQRGGLGQFKKVDLSECDLNHGGDREHLSVLLNLMRAAVGSDAIVDLDFDAQACDKDVVPFVKQWQVVLDNTVTHRPFKELEVQSDLYVTYTAHCKETLGYQNGMIFALSALVMLEWCRSSETCSKTLEAKPTTTKALYRALKAALPPGSSPARCRLTSTTNCDGWRTTEKSGVV